MSNEEIITMLEETIIGFVFLERDKSYLFNEGYRKDALRKLERWRSRKDLTSIGRSSYPND